MLNGILLVVLVSFAALAAAQTEVTDSQLRNNPFSRPLEVVNPPVANSVIEPQQPEVLLTLNGTLVAGRDGENSFADIGGKVFALGEEINGQRLVEVHPRYVVLAADTRSVILWVDGAQNDE